MFLYKSSHKMKQGIENSSLHDSPLGYVYLQLKEHELTSKVTWYGGSRNQAIIS